jgi:hypothetical protein
MRRLIAYALLIVVLAGVTSVLARPAPSAQADCAFPVTPTTYEDLKDRGLFLDTIDLAAFNMLFPGDPYFGIPDLELGDRSNRTTQPGLIPPVLLKSIAYIESSITQAGTTIPFGSIGTALVSFDCGYGVAQVTSGMTLPEGEDGRASPAQALVATHYAYNIARGAAILASKWNDAPENLPIAGTNTGGNPLVIENWYFAVWAYNGFTGPGANRSNHPMDPIYGSWPRKPYSCGPSTDGKGHNRSAYPYQELVFGCAANPPVIDGKSLWKAQEVTLPDLKNTTFKNALKLDNFIYPFSKMDIPSPLPAHLDKTTKPAASDRDNVLGDPQLKVSKKTLSVGFKDGVSSIESLDVLNPGTGVLAWYATPSAPWLQVTPYAGASVGSDLPCAPGVSCDRVGHLEISVDPATAPKGAKTASITLSALGTNQTVTIQVTIDENGGSGGGGGNSSGSLQLGAPGVAHN